ncbi:MAG: class I SAM-dependent methyltransferase [Victivallales bacterium]|nr:class I SAM-dependent methyltransferase [Victivallales bacterium]
MPNYDKIKLYYDEYGRVYDAERLSPYYRVLKNLELSALLPLVEEKKVLEIGCGTGLILNEVNKHAKEAWGIDLSDGMLAEAQKKNLNVMQANAIDINFPDSSFDLIYSFKVLSHIPEYDKALSEIHRLLRENGLCVLEFYNPYSIKFIANKLKRSKRKVYIRYDSLHAIKKKFKHKFHIEAITGIRTIIPTAMVVKGEGSARIFEKLELRLSNTPLSYFASYLVITAKKI